MRSHSKDQPSRDGGVVNPTDEQLEGATADGGPLPDVEPLKGPADASSTEGPAASLETELATERDRNLRLRAELENLRNRTARELSDTLRYAALPMARDLLPVLDNIDRAMEAAEKAGESGPLVEGIRMVRQQLVSVLNSHHAVEIEALSKPFDPQFHAAILHQPSSDVPADHVSMVTQSGYRMHDRVVRPSQVIVSSGPSA
jgi:molecular chaperone GrpE